MKQISKHIIILFLGLAPILSKAQKTNASKIIESIIEGQLQNIDEGTNVGLIIEDLQEFAEKPLNINSTSEAELSRLYILNDIQISKLLDYIKEYGPAYSIYELKIVDGFSQDILTKLEPFIWFGPVEKTSKKNADVIKYGKHQVLLRTLGILQEARGYQPKVDGTVPYEGNRIRYYTRYRFETRNKFSAGFTAEKDPGESFLKGSNKNGFDFYSAHASIKFNTFIESVTIGDFLVRAGQGLVMWQEYSMGKSENILNISKTNRGIRPFTSVEENLYFRGIATTMKFDRAKLSVFYSQKKDDGNIVADEDSLSFFTSLQTSGYHRTKNEIEDKNAVLSQNSGLIFTWNFNHLMIGTTWSYQHFNMPFVRSSQLYNQYRFRGTDNITGGVDYLFSKGKYQFFGEAAISKSKGKAFLQGGVAQLNDQLGFSLLFRHFDKNYHAYWSNTFTEGSSTNNETGLYMGIKILPVKYVTLTAYSDYFRSGWINYSTAGPSQGWDIFAQMNVVLSNNFEFYIRYKNEEKDQKFIEKERYINLPEKTQKTRFHLQYKKVENLVLKTRFEHVFYRGLNKENGFMIFQDVQFIPQNFPANITVRLAWINTDSYNSRIYAYENDLLYTFSIPPYYGKSIRAYLNLKYTVSKKMDFWMKFANSFWSDRETISSGYNEISGSNKTELKFQLRLKF